jgi:RNA polymerase sigma-70 factor (ECF subfamily)
MADETLTLIRRSLAGDDDAFAALFHAYKNLVYRTALLMLDSPDEADDALQDVFVSVHRSLSGYRPERARFSTWLHRVTVNHCLNRRRRRLWPALSLDALPTEAAAPDDLPPEDRDLAQALGRLSDKLRVVVVLRYYWGLPYAEIASILDVPLGTVKSRLDLALRALRRELGDGVPQALGVEGRPNEV